MNKVLFKTLVTLMSIALLGIVFIQVYWIRTSLLQSQEQFKYQVQQALNSIATRLEDNEVESYIYQYERLRDSVGKPISEKDLIQFHSVHKNIKTNETISYLGIIKTQDFNINLPVFRNSLDSIPIRNYYSNSRTEIFRNDKLQDQKNIANTSIPDQIIEQEGELDILKKVQFDIFLKNTVSLLPIENRVSITELNNLLKEQFKNYGIDTPYEFAVYSNEIATKVKSENFIYDDELSYRVGLFQNYQDEDTPKNELLVTFPHKKRYLMSDIVGITILSILFTIVIVVVYINALNQWLTQRKISEIKTDFINNMTHEFKTPIATINLALDAIKNPKVRNDQERANKYLVMIREENKRLHAQVENILRISKLEKKEFDIDKEVGDVNFCIENAIEHVALILENKDGHIISNLNANRTTALLNDMHFTNVIANILENAIKYSDEKPIIEIFTENVKDFIIIKIKDNGVGMSKNALKHIFDKFYREPTGNIHNVKGHGLGLAYVKSIVQDHNGQIHAESEKGKGSTFIIKLPLIN
ncbi:MAG: HAMP domain-containing sensor histidine kinase [Bacteroidota bacterium]|nr:HAMP domain-containing sensor histidine kinase [Bacteroidota bacterium]